ncbi:MAG TPA: ABC transporter permease [Streptosporangiaceae bacterium]
MLRDTWLASQRQITPVGKMLRDTWLVFQRQITLVVRTPIWIPIGLAQPVVYLLLFAPMLKKALIITGGPNTYTYAYLIYVPGLLVAMACLGGLWTGLGLLAELRAGIIERARVTPVSRSALLFGRALREVAILVVQGLVITILAIPLGLSVRLGDVLLAYLLFALLALMATVLSYGICLQIRSEAALGPLINTVSQPVMLLAGVLLPLTLAPLWLRQVANWNPFYWATLGMRALFAGHPGDPAVWQGLLIVLGLAAVATLWSARLFSRSLR